MNTKLHAVTDADGRPLRIFMTAGQVSDYTGAAALLGSLPNAEWLLADRGYDADWFRDALKDKGIKPCNRLMATLEEVSKKTRIRFGLVQQGAPKENLAENRDG